MAEFFSEILLEARQNKVTRSWTSLNDEDVVRTWLAVASVIRRTLAIQHRGIVIPNLGTFTIAKVTLEVGGGKMLVMQRPVFVVNEKLAKIHGLRSRGREIGGPSDIIEIPMNFTQLAFDVQLSRDQACFAVSEMVSAISRMLLTHRNVAFPLDGIGLLFIRSKKVRMKFFESFVESVNGMNSLGEIIENEAVTGKDSFSMQENSECGQKAFGGYYHGDPALPNIEELKEGLDVVELEEADTVNKTEAMNAEDNAVSLEQSVTKKGDVASDASFFQQTNGCNELNVHFVEDAIDKKPDAACNSDCVNANCEENGCMANRQCEDINGNMSDDHVVAGCVKSKDRNLQSVCSTDSTLLDWRVDTAEFDEKYMYARDQCQEPLTENCQNSAVTANSYCSPPKRNHSSASSESIKFSKSSLADELSPFTRGRLGSVSSRSSISALSFTGRKPEVYSRPISVLSGRSSVSFKSAHSNTSDKPVQPLSSRSGSSCTHTSGQELCYICYQRARNNVPVDRRESRRQEEEQLDQRLYDYQKQKCEEFLKSEEERKLKQKESSQITAECNLQTVEEKEMRDTQQAAEEREFHPSFLLRRRPLTPPMFIKQDNQCRQLDGQVTSKQQWQQRMREERDAAERAEQARLAAVIAADREKQRLAKDEKRAAYRQALHAQIQSYPPPLQGAYTPRLYFGLTQPDCAAFEEKRRKAQELAAEQREVAVRLRQAEADRREQDRQRDRAMLDLCRAEHTKESVQKLERIARRSDALKRDLARAAEAKKERDAEVWSRDRDGRRMQILDEMMKYRRCKQCKRKLCNDGATNVLPNTLMMT